MGVGPFKVSACDCEKEQGAMVGSLTRCDNWPDKKFPNPNPRNFKVLRVKEINARTRKYLVAMIRYPDCTNFEGDKILVFENMTENDLMGMKKIDPHFCNQDHTSPIARFKPTEEGWISAIRCCENKLL